LIKNKDGSKVKDMELKESKIVSRVIDILYQYPDRVFFGFVENMELSDVFKTKGLKDIKHQAFLRYMNRESHPDGINNTFDTKEFDCSHF